MNLRATPWFLSFALCALLGAARPAAAAEPASSIPAAALVTTATLAARLGGDAAKPLILQVGFRTLYDQAHIAGAEFAGPAGQPAGLALLRQRVAALPRDAAIVIYCGCCPWSHCPNIAAAYNALQSLGFSHVSVLYIPDNFGDNWVSAGYPVSAATAPEAPHVH